MQEQVHLTHFVLSFRGTPYWATAECCVNLNLPSVTTNEL